LIEWEAWFALAVAVGLLGSLAFRLASTDLLAVSALAVLILVQNLSGSTKLPSTDQALAGFGSKGLFTVAMLFVVVTGLELTGGTTLATGWLLARAKTLLGAQIRLLVPVAVVSGFMNNTPVVAALLPVVSDLSKQLQVSVSRLLLPLSYATILGGMCTLLGTSTNLIVRDLYTQQQQLLPLAERGGELSFFTPAWVGLPATAVGLLYMILCSARLLPERKPAVSVADDPRQYTVEMQVEPDGPVVGKTIEEAGLRRLAGLYIAEIQRASGEISPAKPQERLRGDDVLILVGALESVVDLRKIRGLATPDDQARKLDVPVWRRTLVEAVVSSRCALLGKTIREGQFRSRYNAAVVAVARGDKRLSGKIGDVRLEAGDVLLLEASPSFLHRQRGGRDFYLTSSVEKGEVRRHERAWLALLITACMVMAASFEWVSILTAAMVAAMVMIFVRCCTTEEARRSIDWSVLIVIGAAIGIGSALHRSGAAEMLAEGLLAMAGGSPLLSLAAVYIATALCTELITNNAAAVLMFSIGWQTADKLDISPVPFVVVVMIAASASFLTPFGYQTNTMVYGVGGYSFRDYFVFGLPLSLIVFAVSMVMIPLVWF
jgi:di/tricarboxylate transporter